MERVAIVFLWEKHLKTGKVTVTRIFELQFTVLYSLIPSGLLTLKVLCICYVVFFFNLTLIISLRPCKFFLIKYLIRNTSHKRTKLWLWGVLYSVLVLSAGSYTAFLFSQRGPIQRFCWLSGVLYSVLVPSAGSYTAFLLTQRGPIQRSCSLSGVLYSVLVPSAGSQQAKW